MSKKIIIYIIKSLFQHGFCWLKILFFFSKFETGQCWVGTMPAFLFKTFPIFWYLLCRFPHFIINLPETLDSPLILATQLRDPHDSAQEKRGKGRKVRKGKGRWIENKKGKRRKQKEGRDKKTNRKEMNSGIFFQFISTNFKEDRETSAEQ